MERKDLTYTDAIKICFSKFADFSGRARRQEYWYFVVFNMLIQAALNALGRLVFGSGSNMASVFSFPLSLWLGADSTMSASPERIISLC